MIKANELRIGNLVNYSDRMIEVEEVLYGGANRRGDGGVWHPEEDLDGIALTEEWLERMGFQFNHYVYTWDHNKMRLRQDDYMPVIDRNFQLHEIAVAPKYVHQLQNLYFALTGEELTIKEKP